MEHDALGLVRALGDVVLLPLVRHDLPRHAEGRRGHQDPAAGDGGRHANAGQREAAPGGEGGQAKAEQGQRATLRVRTILWCCLFVNVNYLSEKSNVFMNPPSFTAPLSVIPGFRAHRRLPSLNP